MQHQIKKHYRKYIDNGHISKKNSSSEITIKIPMLHTTKHGDILSSFVLIYMNMRLSSHV